MLWHAMPPELNTARLMAGAGPAPMLQAAAGWAALGAALEAQADQLAAILASLAAAWTGTSGERAVAAATPMVAWLRTASMQAQKRGLQASAQAAAYTAALAMTPSLPEIAANHMTRAVLTATNFLGINTVPIGVKETDYFVRMWNQAAAAMDAYQAETAVNTMLEPLPPMKPIVLPDSGAAAEAGAAASMAQLAAKAADPTALARLASDIDAPVTPVPVGDLPVGDALTPFLTQLGTQLGQFSGPLQQLTSMLQQTGSTGGLGGDKLGELGDREAPELGMLGAPPLSTHPLAGGAGPSAGAGLLRADSMPGAGGSPSRTPLLSQLLDKGSPSVSPAAVAGTAAGAGTSAVGGGAPMGAMGGQGMHSAAATRPAMAMPAMLTQDPGEPEPFDVDNEDEW
jgi:PPE-repeat protein